MSGEQKYERRWLVNTRTKEIWPYMIDRETKMFIPTLNIDLGSLLVDREYIKTGYLTDAEARKQLVRK